MRWIILIAILIAIPVVIGMLMVRRPGRTPQPEPIDADTEPNPPAPETTRHMDEPPPGSRGDREQKGMP